MGKISINLSTGDINKDEDIVVGIDLGTTNSLVAYSNKNGEPAILKKEDDSRLIPSVIYFDENTKPVVGKKAVELMQSNPHRSIFSIKRLMGKSHNDVKEFENYFSWKIVERDEEELVRIKIDDKYFTPIELSAFILSELKEIAEAEIGATISKAVITVPAYFNDSQRQATKDAGKLAGLNVLRIVNEPTAASLAYGLSQDDKEQTVAVYDLGGGTFDISILRLSDGVFDVLSTNGNTFLGGDDFDKSIVDFWIETHSLNCTQNELTKLRLIAETAKKHLSQNETFKTEFKGKSLQLSQEKFKELTAHLIEQTIRSCELALKDAELGIENIDHVILVGGSTRMPQVKSRLKMYFNREIADHVHPDEAVALGAAIQADILSGKRSDMLLLDVTPLSLGIETIGGLMDTIIPRNSKIPAAVGRNYTTSIDGQKNLKVAIYQGERDLVEHNRKLGEFILSNIPPMAAGIPKIEIKFLIDADGILQVVAKELRSGVQQDIQIKPQYGISEEDMAKMLMDSIQNASDDMSQRALIEAKTEAQAIVQATDRFIEQNSEWLTKEQIKNTVELKNDLSSAIESGSKDDILKRIDQLNDYTTPLAQDALDKHIAEGLGGQKI